MDNLFDAVGGAPPPSPLLYRHPATRELVELARIRGSAVALPTHFHDEDQLTFVVSGRRRFRLGGGLVKVMPGHGAFIPAGTPHSSLDEPDGVVCFNSYLRAGRDAGEAIVAEMVRRWHATGCLALPDLAAMVRAHPSAPAGHGAEAAQAPHIGGTVSRAADAAGMSREGFSRAFRRTHDVAPSVFRTLSRLNQARHLLRAGAPLAAAAVEAGFADQSHLGRCFRRAFGVTPGFFRAGFEQGRLLPTCDHQDV